MVAGRQVEGEKAGSETPTPTHPCARRSSGRSRRQVRREGSRECGHARH